MVALLVIGVGVLVDRGSNPRTSATPPPTNSSVVIAAPGLVGAFDDIRWVSLGGVEIPTSDTLGPRDIRADGIAAGFAHNPAGAVVASLNLIGRTSGLVPASVYEATIAQQTDGDDADRQQAIAEAARDAASLATAPLQITTTVVGYRIDASSDPDDLVVTLLSRATGPAGDAFVAQSAEVRWIDGDWRYVLPAQQGQQVTAPPTGIAAFPGRSLTTP